MEDLKPCPFCGAEAGDIENYGDVDFDQDGNRIDHGRFIKCVRCAATIWRHKETREEEDAALITAWNKRV